MREIGDFFWFGEQAFMLEVMSPLGTQVQITPFDPGITREQDFKARDPLGLESDFVRAAKPLEFRHDVDAAIAEAREKGVPCFVKFETSWCPPCKLMAEYVFTAQDVVDAARDLICVKIDGDERSDLLEKHRVEGFPTGLMLGSDGSEVARFLGYQDIDAMVKFLGQRVKTE